MTVRAPLFVNGSNQLQEMTTSQVTEIVNHITYQYGLSPSVTITVGSSNVSATTHFPNISDTRFKSGDSVTSVSTSNLTVGDPSLVTIPYNRMTRIFASVTPTSDTGTTFPVYYTGGSDGHVRAMSLQDMKDTFLHPAIDLLIAAGTPGDTAAGTYIITTSINPVSGFTLVSTNPVFIDTKADISQYDTGGIGTSGTSRDLSTNHAVYYLHIKNSPSAPSYTAPVFINGSNNLQQYSTSNFGSLIQGWIRETAAESTDGYQIQYNINGTGNTRTTIEDSRFETSSGAQVGERLQRFVGADDYRAQDRPAGTLTVKSSQTFKITRG